MPPLGNVRKGLSVGHKSLDQRSGAANAARSPEVGRRQPIRATKTLSAFKKQLKLHLYNSEH